jgi:hypothetical protein
MALQTTDGAVATTPATQDAMPIRMWHPAGLWPQHSSTKKWKKCYTVIKQHSSTLLVLVYTYSQLRNAANNTVEAHKDQQRNASHPQ